MIAFFIFLETVYGTLFLICFIYPLYCILSVKEHNAVASLSLGVLTVTKEGLSLINTKRTARGDHAALVRNCLESAGAITDQLTAPELKPGTYVFELLSKEYRFFL